MTPLQLHKRIGPRWALLILSGVLLSSVAYAYWRGATPPPVGGSTDPLANPQQAPAATPAATSEDRMAWFRRDKFGLFIHWGPYSNLAGEWQGHRVPVGTEAEWIMQRFNIPVAEYRQLAHQFNPTHFNADEWVKLAQATGMKYIVVTAKHHDGFAMYHSQVSQYNIVDWTPFGRDPLMELSQACQKVGIRFCVYYSHREDWDDPDGYGNNWDYDRSKKNFERYLEQKSKPQLRELLTNYGPLGLVWFDRGMDTPEHARQIVDLVHQLQPRCLISGRVGSYGQELMGDFQDMGDNGMPVGGLEEYWETPQTLNTTWGFSRFDQQWKTPGNVIHRLVEIVSQGGNYLLNIGPTGDGTIPAPSVATLRGVGAWMQKNSESICGTSASPLPEYPWGRSTVKAEKVYLHVSSWPADGTLRVSGLKNTVRSAYLLTDPSHDLAVDHKAGVVTVALPATCPDVNDTVIVLNVDGPPQADPQIVTQDTEEPIVLNYLTATTSGKAVKRFNREGGFHIAKWSNPSDSITWRVQVSQAGEYLIRVRYAARDESRDDRFVVTAGATDLSAAVTPTPGWFQYQLFDVGTVRFAKAGEYLVQIRPTGAHEHNLMYFESLLLEPKLSKS
jgi:alpha-L-fucosidase